MKQLRFIRVGSAGYELPANLLELLQRRVLPKLHHTVGEALTQATLELVHTRLHVVCMPTPADDGQQSLLTDEGEEIPFPPPLRASPHPNTLGLFVLSTPQPNAEGGQNRGGQSERVIRSLLPAFDAFLASLSQLASTYRVRLSYPSTNTKELAQGGCDYRDFTSMELFALAYHRYLAAGVSSEVLIGLLTAAALCVLTANELVDFFFLSPTVQEAYFVVNLPSEDTASPATLLSDRNLGDRHKHHHQQGKGRGDWLQLTDELIHAFHGDFSSTSSSSPTSTTSTSTTPQQSKERTLQNVKKKNVGGVDTRTTTTADKRIRHRVQLPGGHWFRRLSFWSMELRLPHGSRIEEKSHDLSDLVDSESSINSPIITSPTVLASSIVGDIGEEMLNAAKVEGGELSKRDSVVSNTSSRRTTKDNASSVELRLSTSGQNSTSSSSSPPFSLTSPLCQPDVYELLANQGDRCGGARKRKLGVAARLTHQAGKNQEMDAAAATTAVADEVAVDEDIEAFIQNKVATTEAAISKEEFNSGGGGGKNGRTKKRRRAKLRRSSAGTASTSASDKCNVQ